MIALTDEEDAPEQLYIANRDGEFDNAILNNLRMIDGILRNIINLSDVMLDDCREAIRDLTQATIEGIKAGNCDAIDVLDMIQEGIEENEVNSQEFSKRCDRVRDLLYRAEKSAKRYWDETTSNFLRAKNQIIEAKGEI